MEYKEYYTYIFEDCDCLHEADCGCGEQEEGYPGFGYKETESDFKDPRLQKAEAIVALLEKNSPTNPSKWAAAKAAARRKFKVYPSAYANLWAAKKYKSMGGGWRKTKKEYHVPHKRRDPMGQEDADVNNDGKVNLTDKMLKAKRDLYKRYLVAQKKGQKSL